MNSKYPRAYIEKLIALNPSIINLEREVKIPAAMGGHEIEIQHIEIEGLFYDRKGRREVVTDYGRTYTGVSITKLLVLGDTDIRKGDKFTYDGVRYKVFYPKTYGDICIQVELEVVE